MASIDLFASLAQLAVSNGYIRPKVDNSMAFEVIDGYHPIVQASLKNKFIANNCHLKWGRSNMAYNWT